MYYTVAYICRTAHPLTGKRTSLPTLGAVINSHLLAGAVVDEVKAPGTAESVNTHLPTVSTAYLIVLHLHSPLQFDWELVKTRMVSSPSWEQLQPEMPHAIHICSHRRVTAHGQRTTESTEES